MRFETWRHLAGRVWLSSSTLHGKVNPTIDELSALRRQARLARRKCFLARGDELEEHRRAFLRHADAAHEGVQDLVRLGDSLAVTPHGLREVRVVAGDIRR